MTTGEVVKLDESDQTITIDHGPIANLDMPAMTMMFKVADPAMLKAVKAGDKIRFAVENVDGQIAVTKVELAK